MYGKVISTNTDTGEERKDRAVPFGIVDLIDLKLATKSKVLSPLSVRAASLDMKREVS